MSGEILKRIAERSQAADPPEAWKFLTPVTSVRTLPFADPAVMDALQEEFTQEQLEAARVLVRGGENQLGLNPVLRGESAQGLFLRRTKDDPPFDIVNQNGSLTTDDPPVLGCNDDYFTNRASSDRKSILVTFSDEDLAVSRMLGLPSAPAAGLPTVDGAQVRRLFHGAPRYPDSAFDQAQVAIAVPERYRWVLTGWSVAELIHDVPCEVTSVVERLVKAEEAFGFDTSQLVKIWQPSEQEFSRIRSAAEFQDRSLVRKLFLQGISQSTYSARQFQKEAVSRNATDYDAARHELIQTIARAREPGSQSSELSTALAAFDRSFDKSVADAIIHDAMSAPDSVDRALLLTASDLMRHWHQSSSLVRSTQDRVRGRYQPQEEALDPDELRGQLRVVDGLVKIHRELTRNK